MERPLGVFVLLAMVTPWLSGVAFAQSSMSQPDASQLTQQVKSGANRVGNGFVQMGEGIKQGAIMTWQAVQDGAAAAAARFNGSAPSPPLVRQNQ